MSGYKVLWECRVVSPIKQMGGTSITLSNQCGRTQRRRGGMARKEEEMRSISEKEATKEMIKLKLDDKTEIIVDSGITDSEFVATLLDICTLNKLRDAMSD